MPIQLLSEQTIAQIAAGEVVERPASVVKELIENSLDAGASNLHIMVNGGGRKLIRVSDDGDGIPADEVELAFTRHATSKLQTIDDLMSILTLGFRGEALASIAAVSRLHVTTRHRSERAGTSLKIEGGQKKQHQASGSPVGTVINIENLFYNTPARLKFLKKETTEKRHINNLITRYAMAYPQVRFVLEHDGREMFRSTGSGQLADVIVRALGLDQFKEMLELAAEDTSQQIRVYGFTSTPDLHRSDRSNVTLFVNGRWIQDATLTYAVVQAYHSMLEAGRYPVSIIMIELPPDEVDVNVHPTKAEVRFRDQNEVFSVLQRAVRQAVIAGARPAAYQEPYQQTFPMRVDLTRLMQLDMDLPLENEMPDVSAPPYVAVDPTAIPEGPGRPIKPRTLPLLRVIGQIGGRYIVTEGPSGMYLIDQNAAHERILFEHLHEAYQQKSITAHPALASQTLELTAAQALLVGKKLDLLAALGFELEPFGLDTFVIRCVPELLAGHNPIDLVQAIAIQLKATSQADEVIRVLAAQAAVRSGQILNSEEMQSLVRRLERCESPYQSPDGRATLLHMTSEQIAREFGRM